MPLDYRVVKPNANNDVLRAGNGRCGGQQIRIAHVAGYRLYGLDGVKKVASAEWIEAEDDETAIEAARNRMNGRDWELWQGTRLVACLPG